MQRPQRGFTLVEIAIVLVVIGLLLGGVLKGQELIASARVRSLTDQQAGIQAAYYGFIDRYRQIPGDMLPADAANAIGVDIATPANYSGGDGNGELQSPATAWTEPNAVWIHLSDAGFIRGTYTDPGDAVPTQDSGPLNVFNGNPILTRHALYNGDGPERLLLHMGRRIPVDIAREFDVKLDDGNPHSGVVRSVPAGTEPYESDNGTDCTDSSVTPAIWNIQGNSQDCNPTYLF